MSVNGTGLVQDSRPGSLSRDFSAVCGFQVQARQPVVQIDLTDIAPNVNFEVPNIAAADRITTAEVHTGPTVDTQALDKQISTVENDYMALNAQAEQCIVDAMEHALGPEAAGQLALQEFSQCSPGKGAAIAAVCDPTGFGFGGSMYMVKSELEAHADHIGDADVLAQLDQVCQALADAHEAEMRGEVPAIAIPQELDFSEVTPEALRHFINRKPENDRVMQDCRRAHESVAQLEQDQNNYEAHGHEVATAGKIEAALESGDHETLVELAGGDAYEAAEIEMHSGCLLEIQGLCTERGTMPAVVMTREALAPANDPMAADLNREDELKRAAAAMRMESAMGGL